MPTILDVATLAGVSTKTVSRVVNREPYVRADTVAKVEAAIAALGYRPNQSARRLAGGRSHLLAYLYDNPAPSYIAGIQSGAARRCREFEYHLVVEPISIIDPGRERALDRLVDTLSPDGVLLIPPLSDDPVLLRRIAEHGIACARIAGRDGVENNIETPELRGGLIATQHLLDLGHRRIGVIAPPHNHHAARKRVDGYRQALEGAGVARDLSLEVEGCFDFASGFAAAHRLLSLVDRPTAIFATNDDMALGVMAAARQRHLSLPEDLAIVGFDDIPAAATCWPALTTVRQPVAEMGAGLVEALIGKGGARIISFTLVPRASSAPPRITH